jgi:sporulation protein YtfJ
MANENRFDTMFKSSFENIKSMLDSNTVMGTPVEIAGGTTVIPVSKLSVGFATGGVDTGANPQKSAKFGGGGGSGMSVTPIGFLVVDKNGKTEFISVEGKSSPDPVEQACDLLDRTPDIIQKVKNIFDGEKSSENEIVVEEIKK